MKQGITLLTLLILWSCQSTKEKPLAAIHQKHFVELGGEEQYIEVISESLDNPVLLLVHGGPAWPQTPQTRYLNLDLAKDYTLVLWEQRGAGQSYLKNPTPDNMSLEQIIQDGHQATAWAKKEFNQDKILLVGYSWGSIVGAYMAQQQPEDYHAYVGVAQFINKSKGMEIAQSWLLEQATKADDQADLVALDSLKTAENYSNETEQFFRQWQLLNKYRGAVYNHEAEEVVQKAMESYPDYQAYDWFQAWRESSAHLQDDLYNANVLEIKEIDLPVYLIVGRHDWNVPSVLATQWLDSLQATSKKVIWFEGSGHGPLEEEPEKFNSSLSQIKSELGI